ncbi:MAG: hypothetical protein KKH45_10580 [Proteobacteria bacterium]|nr:hypothetical protein [Pseudomonadota bacterium]
MLEKWHVKTCGIELGNWYGFAGIPMETGLASFVEFSRMERNETDLRFEAHVLMYRLDVNIACFIRIDHAVMTAELSIESLADCVLGDAVLHLTFSSGLGTPRFNGMIIEEPDRYCYNLQRDSRLELNDDFRIKIETEMKVLSGQMDLELIPYAALLKDGRIRYHTRALCRGGDASSLLFRTRGSLSCMQLGRCPASMRRWLYRSERYAPRLFRNTQFCAVTAFPKGSKLRLWHRLEII